MLQFRTGTAKSSHRYFWMSFGIYFLYTTSRSLFNVLCLVEFSRIIFNCFFNIHQLANSCKSSSNTLSISPNISNFCANSVILYSIIFTVQQLYTILHVLLVSVALVQENSFIICDIVYIITELFHNFNTPFLLILHL